jgi:phage-related protein (TIGR01555 family)
MNFNIDPNLYVRETQEEVWEGDDMFARIIEKPATEMMRAGFEITISDSTAVTGLEVNTPENTSGKYDRLDGGDCAARVDFVKKVGSKWGVFSHAGKRLGTYSSRGAAVKRLRQIEYFKAHKDSAETSPQPQAKAPPGPPQKPGLPPHLFPQVPDKAPPAPVKIEDDSTHPTEEAVLARYEELHGPERFLEALLYEAAYGGAAILVGANDGSEDLTVPLDLEKIKTFQWANVLTPREMQAVRYYGDPAQPKYGEPMIYRIMPDINLNVDMSISGGPTTQYKSPIWVTREVHESRLIIFPGIVVSKRHRFRRHGWGNSQLVRVWQVLQDFHSSYGSAAHLLTDFAQAVIKIKGLADVIFQNDDDALGKRAQLIDLSRSVARAVILDSEEDFERKATPVTGMPELLQRFEHRLAAAADMPVSVLMGREPSGLSATGDMEIEQWYTSLADRQNRRLKPRLERFLRLIMLSKDGPTGGVEPENWSIEFNPLQAPDDSEQADIRLKQAQADQIYMAAGAVLPAEIAQSRFGGSKWSDKTSLDNDARQAAMDEHQSKVEEAQAEQKRQLQAASGGAGTIQNMQSEKDRTVIGQTPGELPAVK